MSTAYKAPGSISAVALCVGGLVNRCNTTLGCQ